MLRNVQSFSMATLITLALIVGMYALVKMDEPTLGVTDKAVLSAFTQAPESKDVIVVVPKPPRPEIVDTPDVPKTELIHEKINIDHDDGAYFLPSELDRKVAGLRPIDGEFLPIFRAPPVYPKRAAALGLCGWVELIYTVTADGFVRDPFVTASSSAMFESAARKAVLKYKYKPQQVGGKAIEVQNVPIRIVFEMEAGC